MWGCERSTGEYNCPTHVSNQRPGGHCEAPGGTVPPLLGRQTQKQAIAYPDMSVMIKAGPGVLWEHSEGRRRLPNGIGHLGRAAGKSWLRGRKGIRGEGCVQRHEGGEQSGEWGCARGQVWTARECNGEHSPVLRGQQAAGKATGGLYSGGVVARGDWDLRITSMGTGRL